jgi:protein-tyrosine phosphatase
MIEIGRQNQVDLSAHRARHLRDLDLDRYDLVVTLTPDIRRIVIDDYRLDPARVTALEIDDPYGSTIEMYRQCAMEIREAVTRLTQEWS